MKSILLINFDFPPNYGIGGRRWAKLAKGMSVLGLNIDVIKADSVSNTKISPWYSDVSSPNITIHSIPRPLLSKWLSHPDQRLLSKIKYRIALALTKILYAGTPFDISVGWKSVLIKKIKQLYKQNNYSAIIATGAPWQMLSDLADFIKEHKGIKFIVDFRDPWIESKNYGIQGLSKRRLEAEIEKQLNVLQAAHIVTTPCEHITDNLKSFSLARGGTKAKFITLEHFYDRQDITIEEVNMELAGVHNQSTFRIVYAGEVYTGTESIFQNIINDIREINLQLGASNKKIELIIYTDTRLNASGITDSWVSLYPSIGKNIFPILANSDACLIMLPSHKKHEKTTKFFEYLAMQKPLLVASEKGSTLDFVLANKLGFAWKDGTTFEWLEYYISGKPLRDDNFDIASHELQARARKVMEFVA